MACAASTYPDPSTYINFSPTELAIPNLNSSTHELFLKIGQSNASDSDGLGPLLTTTIDAPYFRVFEVSRNNDKSTYSAPPVGSLMLHKVPAQDSVTGVGFSQQFGKARALLNPNIQQIVIANVGQGGTGFSTNYWNPGDSGYNQGVSISNIALANFPHLTFKGFLWHQGEADQGQTQAWYEGRLAAMVAGMRAAITGAANAPFVAGTMLDSWVAADVANRGPIDAAHRNISNYITNSTFANFDGLLGRDIIHFDTNGQREMGRRYAVQQQTLIM